MKTPDLRVFAALEEGRNADQADIVIPDDYILAIISGYFEGVLEDYRIVSTYALSMEPDTNSQMLRDPS